jgi:UDP-galactopyranose mutase
LQWNGLHYHVYSKVYGALDHIYLTENDIVVDRFSHYYDFFYDLANGSLQVDHSLGVDFPMAFLCDVKLLFGLAFYKEDKLGLSLTLHLRRTHFQLRWCPDSPISLISLSHSMVFAPYAFDNVHSSTPKDPSLKNQCLLLLDSYDQVEEVFYDAFHHNQ